MLMRSRPWVAAKTSSSGSRAIDVLSSVTTSHSTPAG